MTSISKDRLIGRIAALTLFTLALGISARNISVTTISHESKPKPATHSIKTGGAGGGGTIW